MGYGWAATSGDTVIAEEWGPIGNAEVFQAEVLAISAALVWVLSNPHKLKPLNVAVFSDSQAALGAQGALGALTATSSLVLETQKLAQKASSLYNITFDWVPGHKDITGNELADSLAKLGGTLGLMGPGPWVPLSYSGVERAIRQCIDKEWQIYPEARHSKLFTPVPTREGQKIVNAMSRKDIFFLMGIITGHGQWRYHISLCSTISAKIPKFSTAKHWLPAGPRSSVTSRRRQIGGPE